MTTRIDWTRIKNDVNGNPRYVCHFMDLLKSNEGDGYTIDNMYNIAIKRANKLGGRKYHTKNYGGGLVFQSYNLHYLEEEIFKLLEK